MTVCSRTLRSAGTHWPAVPSARGTTQSNRSPASRSVLVDRAMTLDRQSARFGPAPCPPHPAP